MSYTRHCTPSLLGFTLLMSTCLIFALPCAAATFTTSGLVSGGEGTIGHGAIAPVPFPFDATNTSVQLGSYPAAAYLGAIYTLLASRDVFNTIDGTEASFTVHAPPFAAHATAGVDLNSLGVSGTVYYSSRGFVLDFQNGNDFNYNLGTNIETRLYRGGELEFYYDAGSGPIVFARSTNVVISLQIDWNTFISSQTMLSSTADMNPAMLAIITSSFGSSGNPVQSTGFTTEGLPYTGEYGIYNDDGTTWGFEINPAVVTTKDASWGAVKARF